MQVDGQGNTGNSSSVDGAVLHCQLLSATVDSKGSANLNVQSNFGKEGETTQVTALGST